jgi:hypothetical protein
MVDEQDVRILGRALAVERSLGPAVPAPGASRALSRAVGPTQVVNWAVT